MPDPNLAISPLAPSEARLYQAIRHETFRPTINKALYTREPSQKTLDRVVQSTQSDILNNGVLFLKCVDQATGEIIAGARWRYVRPKDPAAEQRTWEEVEGDMTVPEPYEESDPRAFNGLYTLFNRCKKEVMGTRSYYALDTLVTHPKHHRRGAGGMLVRWGCEQADAKGVEAYLEASPMAEPLYARYGFQRVKEVGLDLREFGGDEELRFIIMVRPAKGEKR